MASAGDGRRRDPHRAAGPGGRAGVVVVRAAGAEVPFEVERAGLDLHHAAAGDPVEAVVDPTLRAAAAAKGRGEEAVVGLAAGVRSIPAQAGAAVAAAATQRGAPHAVGRPAVGVAVGTGRVAEAGDVDAAAGLHGQRAAGLEMDRLARHRPHSGARQDCHRRRREAVADAGRAAERHVPGRDRRRAPETGPMAQLDGVEAVLTPIARGATHRGGARQPETALRVDLHRLEAGAERRTGGVLERHPDP